MRRERLTVTKRRKNKPKTGGAGGKETQILYIIASCDNCTAVILAAAGLCLAYSLLKRRDAGEVLGIERHIIKPACVICGAGHGQRNEERRGGLRDHFGDAGLDEEVQAKGKITDRGMAVAVSLRHGRAAVLADVGFKCVLDRGRIIRERVLQRIDKGIRMKVEHYCSVNLFVRSGITVVFAESYCFKKFTRLRAGFETVEKIGAEFVIRSPVIRLNICDLDVAELNSLDSVAIGFTVAGELVHYLRVAKDGLYAIFITDARRDV